MEPRPAARRVTHVAPAYDLGLTNGQLEWLADWYADSMPRLAPLYAAEALGALAEHVARVVADVDTIQRVVGTALETYAAVASEVIAGLEPLVAHIAALQRESATDFSPRFNDLSSIVSDAARGLEDDDGASPEGSPGTLLTGRHLRLLTAEEAKRLTRGAIAFLGTEAAVGQIIRELVGPDASSADVLLWSAGLVFAALLILLGVTDSGDD